MLCRECPKQDECLELCRDAELYVDQDNPNYHKPDHFHLSGLEREILRLLVSFSDEPWVRVKISQELNITTDTVRATLSRLKQKAKQIDLWL